MKSLVLYFSRKGNNYVNGSIVNLPIGNTEVAANMIRDITGADIFRVDPLVEYSTDYNKCTEEAADYKRTNARPKLKEIPENIYEYDIIYLGYPNYWGTMPMEMFTLLENIDFSGKRIKPFCTHEGSGMGNSEQDIKKLCPAAKVEKGLPIHGADVSQAKDMIENWIR